MAAHTEPRMKAISKAVAVEVSPLAVPSSEVVKAAVVNSEQQVKSHFQPTRKELDDMAAESSRFLDNLTDDRLGDFVEI